VALKTMLGSPRSGSTIWGPVISRALKSSRIFPGELPNGWLCQRRPDKSVKCVDQEYGVSFDGIQVLHFSQAPVSASHRLLVGVDRHEGSSTTDYENKYTTRNQAHSIAPISWIFL